MTRGGGRGRVLVVEDDPRLQALLREALEREGHGATVVGTGGEALQTLLETPHDLVVLDLNLPDVDGIEVAERLRGEDVPILMLTARGDVASRVQGLYAGAADYVTKPFDLEELLARVHVRLRERRVDADVIDHAGVSLHLATREVAGTAGRATLPDLEFEVLRLLVAHPGRVWSREDLEHRLYGGALPSSNTVEVFVSKLRRRLRDLGHEELIRTVRGKGYTVV